MLIFNAEVLWIILYTLTAVSSTIVDDISLFSLTFFLLGFAAIELSIGLLLLVLMKYSRLSINFSDNYDNSNKNFSKIFSKNFLNKKKF